MRRITRLVVTLAAVVTAATALAPAAAAAASETSRPAALVARPTITIVTPDLLRVDKQTDATNQVVLAGVDARSRARVSWGDGTGVDTARGRCSTRTALAHPEWCTLVDTHTYQSPGAYTITAVVGSVRVAKVVTITAAPTRWTPPAGWVQPAGWSLLGPGATYFPCQTVAWSIDRTKQPANGGQIYNDIVTGLGMLAAETGLTFAETADPTTAVLTFNWGDTGGAAGVGGGAYGRGRVTFDTVDWWPRDNWPGFGIVTQPDGTYAVGHGWLVVHEVMHALGFGHVNDPTAVMNPVGGASAFNAGDLDGLHTLYKSQACPVG